MYNFRYHLVTIVSIFAALALGLLLGVALTGSDLVRDASSNLAQSLSEQFNELDSTNKELSKQLADEQHFSGQLLADWQADRLSGRTIALITRQPKDNDPFMDELSSLVTRNGGIPVVIRLDAALGFGLDNDETLDSLKAVLPEVKNEDYTVTLARALAREWSFTCASDELDVAVVLEKNYPLTQKLVEAKVLEITVNYQPLLDAAAAADAGGAATASAEGAEGTAAVKPGSTASAASAAGQSALDTQVLAYEHAQGQGLPYGVNGVVDTAMYASFEGGPVFMDPTALELAIAFDALGQAGDLPYLVMDDKALMLALADDEQALQPNADANYFALLAQSDENLDAMRNAAQDRDVSCILSSNPVYRGYSVVALLTGANKGVYGPGLPGLQPFPAVPLDNEGNAPLLQAAQAKAAADAAAEAAKEAAKAKPKKGTAG